MMAVSIGHGDSPTWPGRGGKTRPYLEMAGCLPRRPRDRGQRKLSVPV